MSFYPITGRDASATFAGYIYQVNVTIARWLDLLGGGRLELEAGEDIDTVVAAAHSDSNSKMRLLEQLKQTVSNITLRTPDAHSLSGGLSTELIESFADFGIDHQQYIGGWGRALDSIYDKTIASLNTIDRLLRSAMHGHELGRGASSFAA